MDPTRTPSRRAWRSCSRPRAISPSSAKFFFVAAQRAARIFGFREALSLAERGLDGLRGLPEGPERLQLELGLQMIRGLALRSVKGWAAPELESTFRVRARCASSWAIRRSSFRSSGT